MALVDDAIALANRGFRVHPIKGKVPLVKEWPTVATADAQAVRSLFAANPGATGVGVATGAIAGDAAHLLVLDIDIAKQGRQHLFILCDLNGQLPSTVTAVTGSGGLHFYFLAPAGFRNTAGKLAPGIDTRADGGYVCAPPSKHPSGTAYAWAEGLSPSDISIAHAPDWLLALLRPKPRIVAPPPVRPSIERADAMRRASAYLAAIPGAVSGEGGRTPTWAAALACVRGFALSEADAYDLLAGEYNPRCVPPWSEKELRGKIADVQKNQSGPPLGWLLDAPNPNAPAPLPSPPSPRPTTSVTDTPATAAAPSSPAALAVVAPAPLTATPPSTLTITPPPQRPQIPLAKTYASLVRILRDPLLRAQVLADGALEFNDLTLEPTIARRALTDADLSAVRENIELAFIGRAGPNAPARGLQFSANDIAAAVLQVAHERPFHPVADYLRSLTWQGAKILDRVAPDILGVDPADQPIAALLVRKWMISAVARALSPGCKVDTVLILTGAQGAMKSGFFRALASAQWFSDAAFDIHNKDSLLLLRRVWILEWAELDAMTRARTAEAVKAFLTAQVDYLRPPYGRAVQAFPRPCVICGSANRPDFLTDDTGSRRFWPVRVADTINVAALATGASHDRDQLWAEAVAAFDAGEPWWLDKADSDALAATQEAHESSDAWAPAILEWVAGRAVPFTTADILTGPLAGPQGRGIGQTTKGDSDRVGAVLRRAGWERGTARISGHPTRVWVRPNVRRATYEAPDRSGSDATEP